jgi:hypothetical protein
VLLAKPAWAQGVSVNPIPEQPLSTDLDEVDELDETAPAVETEAGSRRLESEALSLSAAERRGRRDYLVSAFIGQGMPWQSYGLAADALLRPDLTFGMFAGGGAYSLQGNIIHQKSYDTSMKTRVLGVATRYFFDRLDVLSVSASLGYGAWDGNMSPHGSDDQVKDESEKLTASFRTSGVVAGVSAALGWVWDSGFYMEWTLFGLQRARVLQKDFSRDSDVVRQAVQRDVESTRVYGLYDLKVGYFF